jgi:hypothetical protein
MMNAGDTVSPYASERTPWSGTIQRVENGKALIAITEIHLYGDLVRRQSPPILAWVPTEDLVERSSL